MREKLTVFPSAEWTPPIHEIQQECCESQVFKAEQFFSYTPHVYIEHTYTPPVVCNNWAFMEFVQGEERCLKFISQDLTFLQSSSIPSLFSNISNTDSTSAKNQGIPHTNCITEYSASNSYPSREKQKSTYSSI